jgi:hypothetical protein
MKNFWLARRKKRQLAKIAAIVDAVINSRLNLLTGLKGGLFLWQRKKDTKTQL